MDKIYGAYGAHLQGGRTHSSYAGERIETATRWYLLGKRPYSPLLRRLLSPDTMSPFGAGGLNRYAYCSGDPINRVDPSGHMWKRLHGGLLRTAGEEVPPSVAFAVIDQPGGSSTPAIIANAIAASMDAASVSSGIPQGSLAPPAIPGAVVLGRLASGSEAPADGPSPAKQARTSFPRTEDIPSTRVPQRKGETQGDPARGSRHKQVGNWQMRTHPGNPKSRIWTSDTSLTAESAGLLVQELQKLKTGRLALYTGYMGMRDGDNWNPETGLPRLSDDEYIKFDQTHLGSIAEAAGINVQVVDAGRLTKEQMMSQLNHVGVHVVSCCFGSSDKVIVDALNANRATEPSP
ncbi:RHS repeat-associated core domain-containing protein [Luteibacter sp.]|jgi:RHS repeat-associated protein|uniref:RHS repeat-associated core domain-containing protein n=1 Tax=Luteibacter sp. TaxID=1886636 RepID=UPI002F3E4901